MGAYPDGIHTLPPVGHVTFVDGKRLVFRGFSLNALRQRVSRAQEIIRHQRRWPFRGWVGMPALQGRNDPG
jgi:hypothetical protein